MTLDELLALLDISTPEELVYFEQFADLMENPQDIPYETLAMLTEGMEPDVIAELLSGYFEDILTSVPDGEDELYTLMTNINTTLGSLAISNEDDAMRVFAEELHRFRSWYLFEASVLCTNPEEGTEREIVLLEALTNHRAKSFTDESCELDFSGALDFPLDEYIVSLGSIIEDDYGDGDSYGEEEDYRDPEEE
ncbi:MAG: hypothetical protein FWH32_04420 [Clostridiales bacterium]|nr:hypothetical protein [Clostridiales bacterium]